MTQSTDHFTARPGHIFGSYPQCDPVVPSRLDDWLSAFTAPLQRGGKSNRSRAKQFLQRVNALGDELQGMRAAQLANYSDGLRAEMRKAGLRPDLSARAFAVVREYADRTLNLRHYDCQVLGGWAILEGMFAEMDTGEGKTLTATLPACAAAFAGVPVHIITVNDYLAERDSELMSPLYSVLGIRSAAVTQSMQNPDDRRAGYAAAITYCTNKQVTFDYLRDRVTIGARRDPLYRVLDKLKGAPAKSDGDELLLRGLCFAIIDEADSVLIDEARTPLKLSAPTDAGLDEAIYREVVSAARELKIDVDFNVAVATGEVTLLDSGEHRIETILAGTNSYFESRRRRNAIVRQALIACHCFSLDQDYLVRNGEIQIIDEHTGRAMPDRSWELGLHQLIEAKEGLEISKPARTIARITYQRFFRRYHRVGAMSGTAQEVRDELWSVYELAVFRVPPNKPCMRKLLPPSVHVSESSKWQAILERVVANREQGRPVLVGTRSLSASETLSALLTEGGVEHQVLNARNDREEAAIIALAGQSGRVTVATNMAGRGTDIKLGDDVAKAGGLHVIVAECNDASRIDRQLHGRSARQGEPGSCETVVSWADDALQKCGPGPARYVANGLASGKLSLSRGFEGRVLRWLQAGTERRHARLRRALLTQDQRLDEIFAFSGSSE
jgi:preprotein translocase subunit SecA